MNSTLMRSGWNCPKRHQFLYEAETDVFGNTRLHELTGILAGVSCVGRGRISTDINAPPEVNKRFR